MDGAWESGPLEDFAKIPHLCRKEVQGARFESRFYGLREFHTELLVIDELLMAYFEIKNLLQVEDHQRRNHSLP